MFRLIKLCLIIFIFIPIIILVTSPQSLQTAFDWIASAYTNPNTEFPGTGNPIPAECGINGSDCAGAVWTGYDQTLVPGAHFTNNGIEMQVVVSEGGYTWFQPVQGNGGAPGIYSPPDITPTGTPLPSGTGTITGLAIAGPVASVQDCRHLAPVRECLDGGGADCGGTYLSGTHFYLQGVYPEVQTGGVPASFLNVATGRTWYLSAVSPSTSYSPYTSCRKTNLDPVYSPWDSVYMRENMTADFLVGFGPLFPWLQVTGGGNTAAGTLLSYMPTVLAPTLLFDTSASASTGIVSVSNATEGMDLSDGWGVSGLSNISRTNWSTNDGIPAKDWYSFYTQRLNHAPILPYNDVGAKPTWIAPSPGDLPYKVYTTKGETIGGNLVIRSPWVIGDHERIVVIVDGSLEIQYPITMTNPNTGFVGFVVKDDITIDPTVGTTWNSTTPVVEGMYVAGGDIKTGTSTSVGTERFVGKGMFVATNIRTQRNLYSLNHNIDTSADLFIYNPAFLLTMPGVLKDLTIRWQEVAP